MKEKLITVVIPVYNEGIQIYQNILTIREVLDNITFCYEFLLIDDGSTDRTWAEITRLSNDIPSVRALKLSRNFGKEAALCAGLENIKGAACIIMDADLQHPPSLIPEMIRLWDEKGFDVVEGVKSSRGRENLLNKTCASFFYRIMYRFSGINLDRASDFKLLDEKVIQSWRKMLERNTFFRGMSAWTGFNRISIPFKVAERKNGNSKWSVLRLFKLGLNAITSFSSVPLHIVTFLGLGFLTGSFFLALQTLYMKFKGIAVSGFTTVILLLLIIGSTLMISLGIIGTYIARIYEEVKYRPRYLICERIENGWRNGGCKPDTGGSGSGNR